MTASNQFTLECFDDGAVLLDAHTGNLFRLNTSATNIWKRSLAGEAVEAISADLVRTYAIASNRAENDVRRALNLPESTDTLNDANGLVYDETPNGYRFSVGGMPSVEITNDALYVLPNTPAADFGICLRAIAPKLVARTGRTVLHAAAVATPGGKVWAFLGDNGAGKTTTAKKFGALEGFKVICEDKLVTRTDEHSVSAPLAGERNINLWIRNCQRQLEADSQLPCSIAPLANCVTGDALSFEKIFLLDANRRSGDQLTTQALTQSEAFCAIFRNAFHGSSSPSEWRRQIRDIAALAKNVQTFAATMPAGLEQLKKAVVRYSETTVS